jgi:FKBP-type peptidyl-prolyl cis-trans isomerase SlpA
MSSTIQTGSRVVLHYTLMFADGNEIDSTRGGVPATFVIGSGDLVGFLEKKLLGLGPGEQRHFDVAAAESMDEFVGEALQNLPRTDFPEDMELVPGALIGFQAPDGQEVPGRVTAVTDHEVTVDFSHPLAGRELIFDVEILAVEPA